MARARGMFSAARALRTRRAAPLAVKPSAPTLRNRFRRAKPIVPSRLGRTEGESATASAIQVTGEFSGDVVSRVVVAGAQMPGELLDRWAAINSGHLPEGDSTPRPPTDEQVAETEAAGLAQIESWGEAKSEQIRDDVRQDVTKLRNEAETLRLTSPGPLRAAALRRARTRELQAEDAISEGRKDLARVAEQVRDQREEMRADLRKQVEKIEEAYAERVAELKAGLHSEVEKTVQDRYFGTDAFELSEFELD